LTGRFPHLVARSAELLLGRRHLARLARVLGDHARLDVPNGMETNGELLVQAAAIRRAAGGRLVAVDVGANRGEWSRHLLRACGPAGIEVTLHAFEPSAHTFGLLRTQLAAATGPRVTLVNQALSDEEGQAVLYQVAPGAGSNSMYASTGVHGSPVAETVDVTTLDRYCDGAGIDRIDLLKVDAEGHDLLVLAGAGRLLGEQRVAAAQFEYNWRWIGARRFLKDAFDLLEPLGYRIGKVTPRGIELYAGWHPELETFREGNYVALRSDVAGHVRTVPWWNRAAGTA
jgi:FkbM family methyltransferase